MAVAALAGANAAWAQGEALQRCPRIAEAAARLACYDAALPPVAIPANVPATVPVPVPVPVPATAPIAAPITVPTAAPVTAPVTAAAAGIASAATTVASPGASPTPSPAPDRFGLPARARSEPVSIDSSVSADFQGWDPNTRIRLSNGQVWQVIDGSSGALRPGQRKVTVTRGALGSFFLEFEGLNRSPRVRRVE